MSAADSVYEYDGSELGAPGAPFMNLLGDSVKTALIDVENQIAGLDMLTDSGWVTISTFGPGWASTSTAHRPRVRRVGSKVHLAGAVTRTGTASVGDILTLPTGFRIAGAYGSYFLDAVVASTGQAVQLFTSPTGIIQIPSPYWTGTLASGAVVPLRGEFFID